MKSALIVSPHFPPSTLAGVHRARHLANHLPDHGWSPTVVCVDPRYHTEKLDPDLARMAQRPIDLVQTPALPAALTRPFGVAGDIGLRGYFHLRQAVARLCRTRRPQAVLITGSPYYPMLMGSWIRRAFDIPVVLDFQDPWVARNGATAPPWTKAALSRALSTQFEPRAVRGADFITSVSALQNEELRQRCPWVSEDRMAAIPIGGDPEDFRALRGGGGAPANAANNRRTFVYVGTALPRATPLLDALMSAVAGLRRDYPRLAATLSFRFVGTSNQPNDTSTFRVRPLAERHGVSDLVTEEPARVPYLEALGILANAHALLMIGSDEPHYTASKIYPGLMSGRPWLSLFHEQSSAHRILSEAGGGAALALSSLEDLPTLQPAMVEAMVKLAEQPESFGAARPEAYSNYTAHAVAGQFAQVFETVAHGANEARRP